MLKNQEETGFWKEPGWVQKIRGLFWLAQHMIFALMSSWKVYACPFLNKNLLLKYLDVMVPLFVFKVSQFQVSPLPLLPLLVSPSEWKKGRARAREKARWHSSQITSKSLTLSMRTNMSWISWMHGWWWAEQQQEYEQHDIHDDAGWQDEQQECPEENEEDVENLAQVLTAARKLPALTQGRNSLDQGILKRGSVQVGVLPVALSATGPVTVSVPNQVWKVLTASQRERGMKRKGIRVRIQDGKVSCADDKNAKRVYFTMQSEHGEQQQAVQLTHKTSHPSWPSLSTITSPPSRCPAVLFTQWSSLAGMMVLDTACQRMCCGRQWFEARSDLLAKHRLQCTWFPSPRPFSLAVGSQCLRRTGHTCRRRLAVFICCWGLVTSAVDTSIPLLASSTVLETLGGVIDLARQKVWFGLEHLA